MNQHRYELTLTWTGNRGEGTSTYRSYGREHTVSAPRRPDLPGSADPTFHGDADRWNPEQLFVASLSQCHMLSYLHACADAGVRVLDYVDRPLGTMRTGADGAGEFTDVLLRPRVVVDDPDHVEQAVELHEQANSLCFIARSVSCPVRHEPDVRSR